MNVIESKDKSTALAQEAKVATACVQNPKKGASHVAVIAARPQGANQVSTFTVDVCKATQLVVAEHGNCQFTNFAVDGASVETKDVVLAQFKFLDGKCDFTGSVGNKHNVKNHM